jgi:hypothetical protein
MGLVPPRSGFLAALRTFADRCGALLIFDEVITGFRFGPTSFGTLEGIRADLVALGKIIGGGVPLAASTGDLSPALAVRGGFSLRRPYGRGCGGAHIGGAGHPEPCRYRASPIRRSGLAFLTGQGLEGDTSRLTTGIKHGGEGRAHPGQTVAGRNGHSCHDKARENFAGSFKNGLFRAHDIQRTAIGRHREEPSPFEATADTRLMAGGVNDNLRLQSDRVNACDLPGTGGDGRPVDHNSSDAIRLPDYILNASHVEDVNIRLAGGCY